MYRLLLQIISPLPRRVLPQKTLLPVAGRRGCLCGTSAEPIFTNIVIRALFESLSVGATPRTTQQARCPVLQAANDLKPLDWRSVQPGSLTAAPVNPRSRPVITPAAGAMQGSDSDSNEQGGRPARGATTAASAKSARRCRVRPPSSCSAAK